MEGCIPVLIGGLGSETEAVGLDFPFSEMLQELRNAAIVVQEDHISIPDEILLSVSEEDIVRRQLILHTYGSLSFAFSEITTELFISITLTRCLGLLAEGGSVAISLGAGASGCLGSDRFRLGGGGEEGEPRGEGKWEEKSVRSGEGVRLGSFCLVRLRLGLLRALLLATTGCKTWTHASSIETGAASPAGMAGGVLRSAAAAGG